MNRYRCLSYVVAGPIIGFKGGQPINTDGETKYALTVGKPGAAVEKVAYLPEVPVLGDYYVEHSDDTYEVIPKDDFEESYMLVDTPAPTA